MHSRLGGPAGGTHSRHTAHCEMLNSNDADCLHPASHCICWGPQQLATSACGLTCTLEEGEVPHTRPTLPRIQTMTLVLL